ncbi:unnamed protein product [Malus baccata var. baccata]
MLLLYTPDKEKAQELLQRLCTRQVESSGGCWLSHIGVWSSSRGPKNSTEVMMLYCCWCHPPTVLLLSPTETNASELPASEAPRAWNSKFTSYLLAIGFTSSLSDTSLFVKVDGGDLVILLLYVDDIILTGSNPVKIQAVIDDLAGVFDLKDMGKLSYFLGLHIQYKDDGSLFITQTKYAKDLLRKADSDWAADITTRRSITGFVVYLGDNPISWQSKKQSTVSRSSTEAEYKALAHCAADIFWIRSVFKDLHQYISNPPSLYCDNLSTLALSSNPVFHSKIKHLDTDYHFVREKVQKGDLTVHYIPTDDQVADVFTKGLHSPIFLKHCRRLGLGILTAPNSASPAQLRLKGE